MWTICRDVVSQNGIDVNSVDIRDVVKAVEEYNGKTSANVSINEIIEFPEYLSL